MSDAMAVLHKLQTGLDVNVKFTGVRVFEYTPECIVFDLLDIPLYHGWLVDPQVRWSSLVVAVSLHLPEINLLYRPPVCPRHVSFESTTDDEMFDLHILAVRLRSFLHMEFGSLLPSSFCLFCINPNLLQANRVMCTDGELFLSSCIISAT